MSGRFPEPRGGPWNFLDSTPKQTWFTGIVARSMPRDVHLACPTCMHGIWNMPWSIAITASRSLYPAQDSGQGRFFEYRNLYEGSGALVANRAGRKYSIPSRFAGPRAQPARP